MFTVNALFTNDKNVTIEGVGDLEFKENDLELYLKDSSNVFIPYYNLTLITVRFTKKETSDAVDSDKEKKA